MVIEGVPMIHSLKDIIPPHGKKKNLKKVDSLMRFGYVWRVVPAILPINQVTFGGTGVPDLERSCFRVKALKSLQLTLDGQETTMSLDTSMGFMQLKPLQGFFATLQR